ncbi:class I SAM-dependent methyltransferase [Actinorugispora endophytica]|uniref:Methyltransferase family protein n=1 Tax=Actinorugispora endophytica TaxID=1605990 RepID=A0A4R6USK2_9ACTN|nr:class I SAM-dependent methyltransferase [Actinorugispora endophytica]TDQ50268.1 methyltransferase family protein [Actinorugispora endophytica]
MSDELAERAAEALRGHPWIGAAGPDGAGGVRVTPAAAALAPGAEPGPLVAEYLDHWGELYDWTYTTAEENGPRDPDLSGWKASDTGLPLPAGHMAEWVERTVELVLESGPELVLELGCGTGLLARRLRERVRGYVGTDVAPSVVAGLAAEEWPGTAFVRAAAHETGTDRVRAALERVSEGAPDARPDCVLLNSVTQCFPDLGYLGSVVRDAIALVRPGGTVVVGDVRHAGLLDAYCHWVERAAAPDAEEGEVAARAAERAERDDELLFDPAALASIAAESPRRVRLGVRAKTMTADTELTRYRFDAVLTVDAPEPRREPATVEWTPPDAGSDPAAALVRLLAEEPVRVVGIPNGVLVDDPGAVTGAALREAVAGLDACVELDPLDPAALAVCAPARAGFRPVAELAGGGGAHEPLRVFVERRLAEAARSHLRRACPDARGVPVTVLAGPAREGAA